MNGVARCTRYAFGPNRLHLCGPDASQEIAAYTAAGVSDGGILGMLRRFETLFPYLETIAKANGIRDPFDDRVVEAYWIGNDLLEHIPAAVYHRHLVDTIDYKKRVPLRVFAGVEDMLRDGARMHHNVHVVNLTRRTGKDPVVHTLDSMDKCRVSWGEVIRIDGPSVSVRRQPLVREGDRIRLGDPVEQSMTRSLTDDDIMEQAVVGDIISLHWDEPCEILTTEQLIHLKRYTAHAIALAGARHG